MLVYAAINTINNKVYLGITKNPLKNRISAHLYDANIKCTKRYFHNALSKYGEDSFVWETVDNTSTAYSELLSKEVYYIQKFKDMGYILYNMTSGGEGVSKKMSIETKRKISKANTGMQNGMFGAFGEKNPSYGSGDRVRCINDGLIFNSSAEAAKYYRLYDSNILQVCKGLRSNTGKLNFEFVDKPSPKFVKKKCSQKTKDKISKGNLNKHRNTSYFAIYDLEGNLIWYGNNRKKCSQELNISYQGLRKSLRGITKVISKKYTSQLDV